MTPGPRTHEGASLNIEAAPDLPLPNLDSLRQITALKTEPSQRRKGHAQWLMCEVCVEADNTQTVLLLEAKPDEDGALDEGGLELFYRRFGFRVVQREPTLLMARQPR